MVAVSLFRERVFTGGTIAVLMWGFGLFGIYFFTSLYLQNVLGFSPTEAGAAFVPMALLMAAGAIVSEKAAAKIGGGNLVGIAMLLMAVGIASVSLLGRHASYIDLMPSFAVIGIGGGLSVTLTAMVLGAMPEAEAGVASGIFNASREVAGPARHHGDRRDPVGPPDRGRERRARRGRLVPVGLPRRTAGGRGARRRRWCGRVHRAARCPACVRGQCGRARGGRARTGRLSPTPISWPLCRATRRPILCSGAKLGR